MNDMQDIKKRNVQLQKALNTGDIDSIKNAVENGANPNQFPNPLIFAIAIGEDSLIQFLIDRGANPHFQESQNGNKLRNLSPAEYIAHNIPFPENSRIEKLLNPQQKNNKRKHEIS